MSLCNEKLFHRVFIDQNERMQRFLISRGMDKEESADAAQDLFLKLWKNCKDIKLETVQSYLYAMAANIIIDSARKAKVRLRYRTSLEPKDEIRDPEYQLRMKDFSEKVEAAITSMPAQSREAFVMSRFEDMKYAEIAEVLGITVKAVEKRMTKAIAHMIEAGIFKKKTVG